MERQAQFLEKNKSIEVYPWKNNNVDKKQQFYEAIKSLFKRIKPEKLS